MKDIEKYTNSYKFYITVSIAILCMITTLISVGFGALNQNMSIAGEVEYLIDIENMIRSWEYSSTDDFHNSTYRSRITSVDFLDNKNVPANAVDSWDVSAVGNEKVMAWVINDPNRENYYKLYIGANGSVVANPNSSFIFYNLTGAVTISFNNNFDTSEVTTMSDMFYKCSRLTSIDFTNIDTSKLENMHSMFEYCSSLTSIDLSNFNTSNVLDMSYLFSHCSSLTSINITNIDTSKVENMKSMFQNCVDLTTLTLTIFDTHNVIDMSSMFSSCNYLTNLNISSFNTSKVRNMSYMFSNCCELLNINVVNFNTSQVTSMANMFFGCEKLTSIDLSNFNTSNVMYMNGMFTDCYDLENLNISSFDTSKVISMYGMFNYCSSLINLDLRSFNTSQVTNMANMFGSCTSIEEIKISSLWDVTNVSNSSSMFRSCTKLPNFSSSRIDKAKAIPTYKGGYLTLDMEGKYFTIIPNSSAYTISMSETGYSSDQTINPSELTAWRVINSNRTGNLELVSEYISSNKVYFSGTVGYSKLVNTLQTIASQYSKSGKTKSVRCMGYDGQTLIVTTTSYDGSTNSPPSTTSTGAPTSGTGQEYGSGVTGDTLYLKDYLLVKNVYGNLAANTVGTSTGGQYWLASRRYDYYSNTNYGFFGRNINEGGELTTFMRLRHYFDGWIDSTNGSGIRPIMTLNNNITITGGTGTLNDPYTIS